MKIRSLTPMLKTKDIKSTIEFYTSLLGFHCNDFNEEWGWASLSKDGIEIMVASPNEHMPWSVVRSLSSSSTSSASHQ